MFAERGAPLPINVRFIDFGGSKKSSSANCEFANSTLAIEALMLANNFTIHSPHSKVRSFILLALNLSLRTAFELSEKEFIVVSNILQGACIFQANSGLQGARVVDPGQIIFRKGCACPKIFYGKMGYIENARILPVL